MTKSLSYDEWKTKIDRLEQAKQTQNWREWEKIAHEGDDVREVPPKGK